MNLLSLTYSEFERLLKAFGITTLCVAAVIFIVRVSLDSPTITALWQAATSSVTLTAIAFGFFARRKWQSPLLAKWLGRPIIHGLWRGQLHTNYIGADGQSKPPIEIAFVIKQTYLTLSIESFTRGQEGESTVEALLQNSKTDTTKVCYIFELRRQYKGENKLTTGSGELKLLNKGTQLKGHYWTNSPTQGDLELQLITRDCDGVDCFDVAEEKWLVTKDESQTEVAQAA
ncbi:Hypothetical protein; putative membrane protein [Herminiimonas arsenicoxydans]|uniref:CD-NTase-associated protein 15 domain-containing protein n=1 Tax=Herminiimonas arsenicoxydans TaxID=204773 RepID=A4G741_HERAR|nr:Hypothetical protein; putative membrane protein [Herminiimonas arsenicoxydans]